MKKKRIQKESFMQSVFVLMFSQVLVKILGVVYKLYLTNREGFGDKGNAIYSSGFQIYALFLTISSIGVPNAVSKLVSEKVAVGDHKGAYHIFKIALITFGLLGFLCSCILFFGAKIISQNFLQIPEAELTLVALSPSIFFVTISCVIKGYFNGRENLKVTANSQTLEQFFKTVLSILLVEIISIVSGVDTTLMAAGANLATTLATILCFSYLYRYYKSTKKEIAWEIKSTVNHKATRIRKTIKQILAVSIPMSLTGIMGTINKNIDSMTVVRGVKNFLSVEEAKIQYGILSGKVDTLVTLPMSFNMAFATALVPSISSAKAVGDIHTIQKRVSFSLLITMLIGLPCMICMILFAEPILKLLFPNAASGSFIYQISCLSIIFIVLEQTISGTLHGLGKMMTPSVALGIGVIIKLILNMLLIPINPDKFILGGTAGAAIATAICHMVSVAIQFKVLKKEINLKFDYKKFIIKPIIATGIMGIISYQTYLYLFSIIKNSNIITIMSLGVAVIVYFIIIVLLKIFSEEEIFMIPYGKKIYEFLKKARLYAKRQIPLK